MNRSKERKREVDKTKEKQWWSPQVNGLHKSVDVTAANQPSKGGYSADEQLQLTGGDKE